MPRKKKVGVLSKRKGKQTPNKQITNSPTRCIRINRASETSHTSIDGATSISNETDFIGFDENGEDTTISDINNIKCEKTVDVDQTIIDLTDKIRDDSRNWSTEMVYHHFRSKFSTYANMFIDEQIDGRSLHLLKREDVLTHMGLRLGPALQIYEEIYRLQKSVNIRKN